MGDYTFFSGTDAIHMRIPQISCCQINFNKLYISDKMQTDDNMTQHRALGNHLPEDNKKEHVYESENACTYIHTHTQHTR